MKVAAACVVTLLLVSNSYVQWAARLVLLGWVWARFRRWRALTVEEALPPGFEVDKMA